MLHIRTVSKCRRCPISRSEKNRLPIWAEQSLYRLGLSPQDSYPIKRGLNRTQNSVYTGYWGTVWGWKTVASLWRKAKSFSAKIRWSCSQVVSPVLVRALERSKVSVGFCIGWPASLYPNADPNYIFTILWGDIWKWVAGDRCFGCGCFMWDFCDIPWFL